MHCKHIKFNTKDRPRMRVKREKFKQKKKKTQSHSRMRKKFTPAAHSHLNQAYMLKQIMLHFHLFIRHKTMTMMIFTYQRTQKKVDGAQMRMLNFVIVELPTDVVDVFDILSSGKKKAREHTKKHNYIFFCAWRKNKRRRDCDSYFILKLIQKSIFFSFSFWFFFLLFACLRNIVE